MSINVDPFAMLLIITTMFWPTGRVVVIAAARHLKKAISVVLKACMGRPVKLGEVPWKF
mgnify:CR=1 FL=1